MADVFQKIISGNDYHQGFAISTANAFGTYSSVSPSLNDISDVAAQTGVLDTRFDDKNYYMGSASDAISGDTGSTDNVMLRSDGVGGVTLQTANFIVPDVYTSSPNDTINHVSIQASGNTTNASVSIVPKGTGAFCLAVPDGAATGGNVRGANAVDLQTSRAAAANVASGQYSGLGGYNSSATNRCSFTWGYENVVSGQDSAAFGLRCTASGPNTFAHNTNCVASNNYGHASGLEALADRVTIRAHSGGRFAATGDAQYVRIVLRSKTTDATPATLYCWSSSLMTIPSGKILYADILISGIKSDGSAAACYKRKAAIKNVGGTTSLVGSVETIGTDHEDNASTDVAITADDTNDALQINVTGIAAETWRWVAVVEGLEIAYGV